MRADSEPHGTANALFTSRGGRRFSANGHCILFCILYDVTGVDAATSYGARRTFITGLANKGVSVLAELAGHRHIATICQTIISVGYTAKSSVSRARQKFACAFAGGIFPIGIEKDHVRALLFL